MLDLFLSVFVKNYDLSEVLPYLQANKSSYHSYLGGGIRQLSYGSETKDSLVLTEIAQARVSALAPRPQTPAPMG